MQNSSFARVCSKYFRTNDGNDKRCCRTKFVERIIACDFKCNLNEHFTKDVCVYVCVTHINNSKRYHVWRRSEKKLFELLQRSRHLQKKFWKSRSVFIESLCAKSWIFNEKQNKEFPNVTKNAKNLLQDLLVQTLWNGKSVRIFDSNKLKAFESSVSLSDNSM